jgi:hypothetical protein
MKNIVFYNQHQIGDLALSRGVVNWIVNNCKNVKFSYLTRGGVIFFKKKVEVISDDSCMKLSATDQFTIIGDDTIAINLGINSSPSFMNRYDAPRNQYNNPIDFIAQWVFFQCKEIVDILKINAGIEIDYPPSISDIVPRACTAPSQKNEADLFLDILQKYNKKILLCNGPVHSLQCPQFSIRDAVYPLAESMGDVCFIYTDSENADSYLENEYCINEWCKIPNLDEIDYLSTFCDIIISRRSGPGEMIQTYENLSNDCKTIIFLNVYSPEHNPFFIIPEGCTIISSSDFSSENIQNIIRESINKK